MACCDDCDNLGLAVGPQGDSGSVLGFTSRIVIPSAQILTLFTSPIVLIPAPGSGRAIKLIEWSGKLQFNSSSYTTNLGLRVFTDTSTVDQGIDALMISSTVSRIINGQLVYPATSSDLQLIENKSLKLSSDVGNPVGGNSDLILYIGYKIINL